MKDEYILDKFDVARYVLTENKKRYKNDISIIKFHKTMYFMFAYWITILSMGKNKPSEIEENLENLSDKLFDAKFAAWAYGPVDVELIELFRGGKIIEFSEEELKEFESQLNPVVSSYFEWAMNAMLSSGDFGLVELATRDISWKMNYTPESQYSNTMIDVDSIINEYQYPNRTL